MALYLQSHNSGPILLSHQGRKANSQACLLLSIVSSSYYLGSLTREPRQLENPPCSFTWVGNQVISPIQLFSASGTPSPPTSGLGWWPCPQTNPDSIPLLPKDIRSGHIQNPKLSELAENCLCENKPVKFGRGDCLLK